MLSLATTTNDHGRPVVIIFWDSFMGGNNLFSGPYQKQRILTSWKNKQKAEATTWL